MIAKSHAIIGLASWIVVAPLLHLPPLSPTGLALAFVGSLLPDIDHSSSWVGRRSRPVSTLVSGVFGHRGITHSALAVAALIVVLMHGGYARAITAALAVGYLSHLAADMLTPRGLRLAWPLRPVFRGTLWCFSARIDENNRMPSISGNVSLRFYPQAVFIHLERFNFCFNFKFRARIGQRLQSRRRLIATRRAVCCY